MGKLLDCISEKEEVFIQKQKVFFVATSALSADHHVNVSPKAPGTSVVVLNSHTVAYADLTGSGAETAAHVLENGRMTLLFCNLEHGPPQILRLHGQAKLQVKEDVPSSLLEKFPQQLTLHNGFRCIFILNVHRVSSSCGYSLPVLQFQKYRNILDEFTERQGKEGMEKYGVQKNSFSIDGLPSLALIRNKEKHIEPDVKDGYVYGKKVDGSAVSTLSYHYYKTTTTTTSTMTKQEGLTMLALGTLLGSIMSSVYFQYFHDQ